jgi:glycosyltransferase involved in cell wall biosynthesis
VNPKTRQTKRSEVAPLVGIGLPTYNRAATLRRAIESVLAQDWTDLELVISANACTDETEAVCREFVMRDNRVRYLRQRDNRGATENFNEVLRQSRGKFFMWLADDDWLDRSYISRCLDVLTHQPEYSLVGGTAKYYEAETATAAGTQINLLQESSVSRLLSYCRQVDDNGTFYGLMRREHLAKVEMQNVIGGDWLLVAALAYMGKVRTLEDVFINRSVGGLSCNIEEVASNYNLTKFQRKNVFLAVATNFARDIIWGSPTYEAMTRSARLVLGCKAFYTIGRRRVLPALRVRLALRVRAKVVLRSIRGVTKGTTAG